MKDSILIGRFIYYVLTENSLVSDDIGFRVYPVVADQGTEFPFIVYSRTNVQTSGMSKDGYDSDTVEFSVTVVSNVYNESITIANKVRKIFERPKRVFENMTINDCRLVGASEGYEENCFVQTLVFSCIVD